MERNAEACSYLNRGVGIQFPLLVVWFFRNVFFESHGKSILAYILTYGGLSLLLVAAAQIYAFRKNKNNTGLLTHGLFALTRHPLYHGMFLADASLFLQTDLSNLYFWATWIIFVALLFAASWLQERETCAQWGIKAEAYFKRTPRFIFEWIWW